MSSVQCRPNYEEFQPSQSKWSLDILHEIKNRPTDSDGPRIGIQYRATLIFTNARVNPTVGFTVLLDLTQDWSNGSEGTTRVQYLTFTNYPERMYDQVGASILARVGAKSILDYCLY